MYKREAQDLLDRYQNGKCTPEEHAKLEAWYAEFSTKPMPAWLDGEKNVLGKNIKNGIDEQIRSRKLPISTWRYVSVAASVILICTITLLFMFKATPGKETQVIYMETYAKPGSRVKVELSDGSIIVLNSGSKLRYPRAFKGKTREVTLLEGEAFFDIQHDEQKMFVVDAQGTRTYVLGTAFNIRAYKLSKEIQITVTRGKVAVKGLSISKSDKVQPVTLLPNEQITIVKTTGNIARRHINASDYTVWIEGKYKFNNETLGNVATVLENSFRVKIRFAREDLKEVRFSSEFNSTDKLEELLFAICRANNLSYTIKSSEVIITAEDNHQINNQIKP